MNKSGKLNKLSTNDLNKQLNDIRIILKKITLKNIKLEKELYGVTKNLGTEMENIVKNYFIDNKKKICGINFHSLKKSISEDGEFELDFLLINNDTIGLVEVKRNLRIINIIKFFKDTVPKFEQYHGQNYKEQKRIYIFFCKNIKHTKKSINKSLNKYKQKNQKFIFRQKEKTQFTEL